MILYTQEYSREGNDAWLIDYVELHNNSMGLYLIHKKDWKGWGGDIKETTNIDLDISEIEESQSKLDQYLIDIYLIDEIKINIEELLND